MYFLIAQNGSTLPEKVKCNKTIFRPIMTLVMTHPMMFVIFLLASPPIKSFRLQINSIGIMATGSIKLNTT